MIAEESVCTSPFDKFSVDSLDSIKREISARHLWCKKATFGAVLVNAAKLRGLVVGLAQNSISTLDGRANAIQRKLGQALSMCRSSDRVCEISTDRAGARYVARRASQLGLARVTVNVSLDRAVVFVAWSEALLCGSVGRSLKSLCVVRTGFKSYWRIREALFASDVRGQKVPISTCSRSLIVRREKSRDWSILFGWFSRPPQRILESLQSGLAGVSGNGAQFVLSPEFVEQLLSWRGGLKLQQCGLRELLECVENGSRSWHSAVSGRWQAGRDRLTELIEPLISC